MDRFVAMTSFRRIVEVASFAAAARQLGLSAAAVTKHVQWLEQTLGAPLLHRTTRRVAPTELGAAYYRRCAQVLDDVDEAEAAVRRDHAEPRGWLRVNAPVSFALVHLGALVARFHARYPQVQVDLTLDDRHINPTVEGVDVVLRIARGLTDSALVARRLAGMTRVVCAAPGYLARHGTPRRPEELAAHACASYSQVAEPDRWRFEGPDGPSEVQVTPVLACNNSLLLRDALVDGIGIGVLPSYVAAAELAAGRLRAILGDHAPTAYDVYALYPPVRQRAARVQAFVELLAAELPARTALPPVTPARGRRGRGAGSRPARRRGGGGSGS